MDVSALKEKLKVLLDEQEVRITAAVQLVFCFLALTVAVQKEFHMYRKNRKKSRKRR